MRRPIQRYEARKKLSEMLGAQDLPSFVVISRLGVNRKTAYKALWELGGSIYDFQGQKWWYIRREQRLKKVKKGLELATRADDVLVRDMRIMRKAAGILGLTIKRVGRAEYWTSQHEMRRLSQVRKKLNELTRYSVISVKDALELGSERVVRKAAHQLELLSWKQKGHTEVWMKSWMVKKAR